MKEHRLSGRGRPATLALKPALAFGAAFLCCLALHNLSSWVHLSPWSEVQVARHTAAMATQPSSTQRALSEGDLLEDKFTIITLTQPSRLPSLKIWMAVYSACPAVEEIVLIWEGGPTPDVDKEFSGVPVPIRVREESHFSLNIRFRPDPLLRTRAVLNIDDDVLVRCKDVSRGFAAWRAHPDRVVGFFPRLVGVAPPSYTVDVFKEGAYNVILTKGAFLDAARFFPPYWSQAYATERGLVDEWKNCEDILMCFVLARETSDPQAAPPPRISAQPVALYVDPGCFLETSFLSSLGISFKSSHYEARAKCGAKFEGLLGGCLPANVSLGPSERTAAQEKWLGTTEVDWGPDPGKLTALANQLFETHCVG